LIQTQQRLEEWGKRMDLRVCINPSYTPTEIWTPTLSHKWHLQRWKGGFNDGNGIEKKKTMQRFMYADLDRPWDSATRLLSISVPVKTWASGSEPEWALAT